MMPLCPGMRARCCPLCSATPLAKPSRAPASHLPKAASRMLLAISRSRCRPLHALDKV